jgi:battenin
MPFSPSSSWPAYKARFKALFQGADLHVVSAFWFFGKITAARRTFIAVY